MMQFGGMVPGPEGIPRMVLAHGGERVTSPVGMGGATGAGMSMTINMSGGIGGLPSADQRMIVRQIRRLVRSSGELGLA